MKQHIVTESGDRNDRAFGSSAFTDVIFSRRGTASAEVKPAAGDVVIRVSAPSVTPAQTLRIAGGCDLLGNWDTARALPLDDSKFPEWSIVLPAASLPDSFEYKFIVTDRLSGNLLAWEEGWNRRFDYFRPEGEVLVIDVAPFVNPLKWKGAGTAIPVFSLRSEESFGVGEFCDLKLMVDWAVKTGQNVIQILPVNDTTCCGSWRESYPYKANSIFALHPQYIRPSAAGRLKSAAAQIRFEKAARELNALPAVDYERVNALKHEYLRLLYAEQGAATLASAEYAAFFSKNASWLCPYAAFSVLRDRFRTADFALWGEYAAADAEKIEKFITENAADAGYWFFVQYHLDRQLREVRNYAHEHGVILKGDIPIGISRTSVDAWMSPELFRMDSSAGAPPDDFAVTGQNWGFPTYDWTRMAEDGYAWWKARFVKMNDFFDAYRIDHILGFFRIWEIPCNAVNALLGHFNPAMPMNEEEIRSYGFGFDRARHTAPVDVTDNVLFVEDPQREGYYHPRIAAQHTECYAALWQNDKDAYNRLYDEFFFRRHNDWWRNEALRKLIPLVSSTRMLVCGEDLGMIPACVPDVMRELQILSLEIERMPKETWREFGNPAEYPYFSVCSPSTHDMSNLRLWWSEDAERRQRYYNGVMGRQGEAPAGCTTEMCEWLVRRELDGASMLTILPLQDWLSIDASLRRAEPAEERINDPANPDQNWNYRMHITLESLLAADGFNSRLRAMINESGR
ncbi:MAG: 4-alpha-glucanotransferase [Alistipes sp.]|nr:4-alpha-glucanotransferase [Alistipes sp.]